VTISNGSITASDIRAEVEQKKEKAGQKPHETLYCSFCGKSQHEVRKLVAGPNAYRAAFGSPAISECVAREKSGGS
jgi:hypothetical protein